MFTNYLNTFLNLVLDMAPYLLLGFLLAGILHSFVPQKLYSEHLSKRNFGSVVKAALFGIPLPLCSCGVIPTAASLRKAGASKGATVSFLTATPQTGVDSIAATWSLLGAPFAVVRPIAALVTALFGGAIVNHFDRDEHDNNAQAQVHSCGCKSHEAEATSSCGCGSSGKAEKSTTSCGCGSSGKAEKSEADGAKETFWYKAKEALHYGMVEMMRDLGRWLVIGLVVAGAITILVPDNFFTWLGDRPVINMVLVLLLSLPMYLCATGSIPIAAALMLKGLSPGAALVLLMAGPATNVAAILVVRQVLGNRSMLLYLGSIIIGAMAFGLGIDYLLPQEWFVQGIVADTEACCSVEGAAWWKVASAVLFVALLAYALLTRGKKKSCGCHK